MISEKMLELLLLERLLEIALSDDYEEIVNINGIDYNTEKMKKRLNDLLEEFLEPYVIESDSKE